jgi:hypothetical protein
MECLVVDGVESIWQRERGCFGEELFKAIRNAPSQISGRVISEYPEANWPGYSLLSPLNIASA